MDTPVATGRVETLQNGAAQVVSFLEQLVHDDLAQFCPGAGEAELGQRELWVLNLKQGARITPFSWPPHLIAGLEGVSDAEEEHAVHIDRHIVCTIRVQADLPAPLSQHLT